MAKFLTLNTHSWMEDEQEKKLDQLAERILQEKYDVICLQEVNQEMESEQVVQAPFYHAVDGAIAIHKDHFAHCLVERLIEKGLIYHWSWAYNHIGFDRFHEGVAILSLKPLKPSELLVSDANDPTDYHTRKVLLAETEVDGTACNGGFLSSFLVGQRLPRRMGTSRKRIVAARYASSIDGGF